MSTIKRILVIAAIVLMVVVGVVFALLNTTTVSLDLLFLSTPPLALSLLIFAAFASGLLLGMLVSGMGVLKARLFTGKDRRADRGMALKKA